MTNYLGHYSDPYWTLTYIYFVPMYLDYHDLVLCLYFSTQSRELHPQLLSLVLSVCW